MPVTKLVLTVEQDAELRALINASDVSAAVATRARIVLWTAEDRIRKDIGPLAGLSLPAVDRWVERYSRHGIDGLWDRKPGAPRFQLPPGTREKVIAATVAGPPRASGLTHWSSRELSKHLKRAEKLSVSFHYIAKVWREEGLKPHRTGTFKLSKDPAFAEKEFLRFLKKATAAHLDQEVHVVLDNLSTHSAPRVKAWLAEHPNVTFHFTPVGSSWINQVETWFGILTKQSIRRGTFTSVKTLIDQIRTYIKHWNRDAAPFTWTATADEILAKVRIVHTNVKQLLDNNTK